MKKLLTTLAIIISLQSVGQNIKTVKDTVIIKSVVDINWIIINGELYQIKKQVSIEKYKPVDKNNLNLPFIFSTDSIFTSTTPYITPYFNKQ